MRLVRSALLLALLIAAPAPGASRPAPGPDRAGGAPFRIATLDSARHFDANRLDLWTSNLGWLALDPVTFDGGLEFPRGSGRSVVYAAGPWIGAQVGGVIRVTVAEYTSEWRPGRSRGGVPEPPDAMHLRTWKVRPAGAWRTAADSARVTSSAGGDALVHDSWRDYRQAADLTGAPTRPVRLPDPDVPGDSADVLAPDLPGDLALWSTFNDADPAAHASQAGGTAPLGLEVEQTVFGFDTAPGTVAFVRWKLVLRGALPLDSTYVTFWVDPDVGSAGDDLVAWDPLLGMGCAYNATNADGVYGDRPPAIGVRLLAGPPGVAAGAFSMYIGGADPASAAQSYDLMRGRRIDGAPWIDPQTLLPSTFPFPGDPVSGTGWLDGSPSDRRFLVSAGPFDLAPGDSASFLFALVVGQGRDRLDSIRQLRCQASVAGDSTTTGFVRPFPARLVRERGEAAPLGTYFVWAVEGAHARTLELSRHPGDAVTPWPDGSALRARIDVDGSGRLRFTDVPLPPGERWTYGLFDPCDPLASLDEVTLDGPGAPFVLEAVSPVRTGPLVLRLVLPGPADVRLSAFGVDGRRLLGRDLGTLPQGVRMLTVDGSEDWRSGLYFLRVDAAGAARTARAILLR